MKIFITGGTGLIGSELIKKLLNKGEEVTLLVRSKQSAQKKFGNSVCYCESINLLKNFDEFDAIINLAGEPIVPRWSIEKKKQIRETRISLTKQLATLILASNTPPDVFISGSAVGFYGPHGEEELNENAGVNNDFLQSVCEEWEYEALKAVGRICLSRTGIVLSGKGGMLSRLVPLFNAGLGAVIGSGNQYISWVHLEDMTEMLFFLLYTPEAKGAFNMTAPQPVNNKTFSQSLAHALHRPCFFTVPAFIIRLILGEASALVLDGQKVMPQKLQQLGYRFSYPTIDSALEDIFGE